MKKVNKTNYSKIGDVIMKLTTERLKRLIREELSRMTETLGTESRESIIKKLNNKGYNVKQDAAGRVTYDGAKGLSKWSQSGDRADELLRQLANHAKIYDSSVGYQKRYSVIDDTDPVTRKPFSIQVDGNQEFGRMAQDGDYRHPHTAEMIKKAVEIYPKTYTLMMAKKDGI